MSDSISPGNRLKQAREAQGKSLSDLAKTTRIAMNQLEGIERDNYDRIAAPIYVKGFIKNYASALGLDPAPLLDDVERILMDAKGDQPVVRKPTSVPSPVTEQDEGDVDVVRAPLKPRIQGPAIPFSEKVSNLLSPVTSKLQSVSLPSDPRLILIGATVLFVLLVALTIRGCRGGSSSDIESGSEVLPVEALEQLLIATPEPILFEIPASDT